MTRSILYSLLILTLSCGNALPRQTDKPQAEPATGVAVAEIPAPAEPGVRSEPKQSGESETAVPERRAAHKPAVPQPNAAPVAIAAAAQPEIPAETATEPAAEAVSEPAEPAAEITPAAEVGPAAEIPVSDGAFHAAEQAAPSASGKEQLRKLKAAEADSPIRNNNRFLPTRRRIDREINKLKFAYKGEVMGGLTASYGTMSSDDTDILLIIDGINADGTIATVKPFIGYFYRDNNCLGVRFGYQHMSGTLDNARYDFGESNDTSGDFPYIDYKSDNYSFGIFHRSYAGLDPKGRFGLFAEFELSLSTGTSNFAYESDHKIKRTLSDNTQLKLAFNPGAAVYIFPNVCATLSFGLGGIQYTSVTQKDEAGNKIGSRKASNMRFRLNVAAINFGMTIHMWDKKKK